MFFMHLEQSSSHPPVLAPVDTSFGADSVSHSLNVLKSIYHYNHWIFASIRDHIGPKTLEVGAGVGNITQFLLNVEQLTCIEPYVPYFDYLRQRFAPHRNVEIHRFSIEECPNESVPEQTFDSIVCLNVLEHLPSDVDVLKTFRRLLKPGGRAIVLVPALQVLYGAMDKEMGHLKRYTRHGLQNAFISAGFQPYHARYLNLIGVFGWWWHGRVRGKTTIPEKETRLFDKLVPFLSAAEQILPPPVGQSVLVAARA